MHILCLVHHLDILLLNMMVMVVVVMMVPVVVVVVVMVLMQLVVVMVHMSVSRKCIRILRRLVLKLLVI
jgi:hypothetical protein